MSGTAMGLVALAWLSLLLLIVFNERQRNEERARSDRLTEQLLGMSRDQAATAQQGAKELASLAVTTVQQMTWTVSQIVSPPPPPPSQAPNGLEQQLNLFAGPAPWDERMHPEELREQEERTSPVMGWTADPKRVMADVLAAQDQQPDPPDPWGSGLPVPGHEAAFDPSP